jgi:uncharacterized protein YoxC
MHPKVQVWNFTRNVDDVYRVEGELRGDIRGVYRDLNDLAGRTHHLIDKVQTDQQQIEQQQRLALGRFGPTSSL